MAEAGFFVRLRGKISGPYGMEALRRMVRQGMLSRLHEISTDRKEWTRATEFRDLFATAVAAPAATDAVSEVEAVPEPPPEVAPTSPPPAGASLNYFYSQNGSSIGPVSLEVLRLLAQNGSLKPDDLVWREDGEVSAPARQMPALSNCFPSAAIETWIPPAPAERVVASRRSSLVAATKSTSVERAVQQVSGVGTVKPGQGDVCPRCHSGYVNPVGQPGIFSQKLSCHNCGCVFEKSNPAGCVTAIIIAVIVIAILILANSH